MRKIGSKAKLGVIVKCPKCKYSWKTKQKNYICCSKCKRYFKRGILNAKK